MDTGPDFEDYLISKKIDSEAFRLSEPELWSAWKTDFQQCHPNSFTVQKLNLINPIRRKYHLAIPPPPALKTSENAAPASSSSPTVKPVKPMMKPRPKMGS